MKRSTYNLMLPEKILQNFSTTMSVTFFRGGEAKPSVEKDLRSQKF